MPRSSPSPSDVEPAPAGAAAPDEAGVVRHGREIKNASSRVTIAFPFSQIKTQEPSAELADLATLLVDLITTLQEVSPDAPLAALAERAEALRARTK